MSKPYDATLKDLLERDPSGWVAFSGYPGVSASLVDADISTVTAASDKVIRVAGGPDWLLDLNFQRGPDATLPQRMHLYNVLLAYRHSLLVRSVAILLSPKANLSNLTGLYEENFPSEAPHVSFRYQVIRVWQVPPETFLSGGLALLPLAPNGAATEPELPGIVAQMKARLDSEAQPAQRGELWTATFMLMGLKYNDAVVDCVFGEITDMEESTTYQAIIRKGKLQAAREILVAVGEDHFGPIPPSAQVRLETLDDVQHIRRLAVQVNHTSSWDELFSLPRGLPDAEAS